MQELSGNADSLIYNIPTFRATVVLDESVEACLSEDRLLSMLQWRKPMMCTFKRANFLQEGCNNERLIRLEDLGTAMYGPP